VIVFTMPGAEINRRRRTFAFFTSQTGQKFPKTHITALLDQQTHGQDCRAPAAMQLQLALRPIGQAMRQAEGRRVHGRRLRREQKVNKRLAGIRHTPRPISLR
jgi:hypothetical protein